MRRIVLSICFIFLCSFSFTCYADDFECYVNTDGSGTLTVSEYLGDGNNVEIPKEIDGMTVTRIGRDAFINCHELESLTIPETISDIEKYAFSGLEILDEIVVSPRNETFTIMDGVLYDKKAKSLVRYPTGLNASEFSIPEGIQSIREYAFAYCRNLEAINIPETVTTIGGSAFTTCTSLSTIIIPEGVTEINNTLFSCCSSLIDVDIPDMVETIGAGAFCACSSLKSLIIPKTVSEIGDFAFDGCDNLIITVERGSYADEYAEKYGVRYTYPDANDWLNN